MLTCCNVVVMGVDDAVLKLGVHLEGVRSLRNPACLSMFFQGPEAAQSFLFFDYVV